MMSAHERLFVDELEFEGSAAGDADCSADAGLSVSCLL
jgi:hypothetical protein